MSLLKCLVKICLVSGAINLGILGITQLNVIEMLLQNPLLVRGVYILFGAAGVLSISKIICSKASCCKHNQ